MGGGVKCLCVHVCVHACVRVFVRVNGRGEVCLCECVVEGVTMCVCVQGGGGGGKTLTNF